jgi:predicted RNase H-like HicB family nuclease
VFWSDEDDGFIAEALDLLGCSAFGRTQNEALTELETAISAWIEAAKAAGNSVPQPSKPAEEENYSGKVLVRMPRTLHAQIARSAKSDNVSLNQYIVFLLTQAHSNHQLQTAIMGSIRKWSFNFITSGLSRTSQLDYTDRCLLLYGKPQKRAASTPALPSPAFIQISRHDRSLEVG